MSAPKVNSSRQLANDLRRTHFTLGTAEPKYKSSEYVTEYTKKGAAFQQNQGDNLNLRASHFQLGNQTAPGKTFVTINQKDFKQHLGFQPPSLNEEKKRDLRSSHFTLGNYNPKYSSLSHTDFPEKFIPYGIHKQEQEEQKQKMRKHNHDFTETTKKQFSSEYNNHFNKQNDPSVFKQGLSAQELKQKVVDLRKSHVVLGEDFNAMQSIAQKDYQFKPGTLVAPANDNVAIRKTNFQLGIQGNDFASCYQQYYVPHAGTKTELNKDLIADLRASHFTLGQEENMYATNTGASYKGPPKGFKPAQTLNPNLQKNHFNIGGDNPTEIANKTTYSNYHRNFGNAVQGQARDQTQDRGSNWKLGGQKTNWQSETQSNYHAHNDAKPADLEGSLKADLRSSHFKFNDVNPKSQFKSLQQVSYGPKTAIPNKLDEELKKDLQANHFKLGQQKTPYQSLSAATYQSHNGKAAAMDPSLAQDLRANHFTYGNGQWQQNGATEYRSNYFWKEENQQAA